MIISASRRTDIPAFYPEWFMRRIREGFCEVPSPFDPRKRSRVSLRPEDVDCIVFWTRNPRPLFPYLAELDRRGYRYYFQITLLGYDRAYDPYTPEREAALNAFQELAGRIGPERVVWRYDPILFGNVTDIAYHRRTFKELAGALEGSTRRVVVSILDDYRKSRARLAALAEQGITIEWDEAVIRQRVEALYPSLAETAAASSLEIVTCAEIYDGRLYGIQPGACIDTPLIEKLFGTHIVGGKDPYQRPACACAPSKDIGVYNTCLFGCRYCYATRDREEALRNHAAHDPQGTTLISK